MTLDKTVPRSNKIIRAILHLTINLIYARTCLGTEGNFTCERNGQHFDFPDPTCPSRLIPHSCTEDWRERPCKCDQDCAEFQECCPDREEAIKNGTITSHIYPYPDKVLPDKMAWEDAYVPYMSCTSLPTIELNTSMYHAYFLISKCPANVPSESSVRLSCEESPPSRNIFSTPMSADGIGHFKNMYCAICNGISFVAIQQWTWSWRCDNDTGVDSSSQQFISDDGTSNKLCNGQFEPPTDIANNMIPRPCSRVQVTTCSDFFLTDSTTSMRCPSYFAPVVIYGTIFQNLHCAFCNGIDVCNDHVDLCNAYNDHIPFFTSPPLGVPPLASYFSFNEHVIAASMCDENEGYDPLTNECRTIYCFSGYVYNSTSDKCERLHSGPLGRLCMSFHTKSNRQTSVATTSADMDHMASAVNSLIVESFYEMLVITPIKAVGLPDISCVTPETDGSDVEYHSYDNFDTMTCKTCFDVELNLTAVMRSGVTDLPATYSTFNGTQCFYSPSFGNITVSGLTVDVPAEWTCTSTFPLSYNASNNNLKPLRLTISGALNEFYAMLSTAAEICGGAETLVCDRYLTAENDTFEIELLEGGQEALRFINANIILPQGKFKVMPDGSALYCHRATVYVGRELPKGLDIMTLVGTILSIISLLVVIGTYVIFPKLRSMAGKSVLALSVALLTTLLLMCLAGVSSENKILCRVVAFSTHYFWLSVFFWMNALAINLSRTFGSRAKIRVSNGSRNLYICYSLYAWGTPALIVGICLTIDLCDCTNLNFAYGSDGLCWLSRGDANLYGFGVPLAALLSLNLILFVDTVVGIRLTKKASERALKERPALTKAKEELILYVKLSSAMGFTWILAFVCEYSNVPELWYVFTAVNSLQGVFILLVFGFNKRNIALWREKLGINPQRATSIIGTDTESTNVQKSKKYLSDITLTAQPTMYEDPKVDCSGEG